MALADRKMSRMALTAMVVGGMIGAGIFSLPTTSAQASGPLGAVIAWLRRWVKDQALHFEGATLWSHARPRSLGAEGTACTVGP